MEDKTKIYIDPRQAMTQALEALEYLCKPIAEGWSAETQQSKRDQCITALREALAEPQEKYIYGTPLLDAMTGKEPKRWAVFCQGCRKEWSVSYPHPGKSICADCDDKLAEEQPAQQALDKMAENAREIGLDYEHPTQYWRAYASDYERGVIDGMQKQMQSSVDRAVNAMAEQPAQQPVAVFREVKVGEYVLRFWPSDNGWMCGITPEMMQALAEQPAQQEPVARCMEHGECFGGECIYTSPPASKPWLGLTDEEIIDHFRTNVGTGSLLSFADGVRYAEAKLREKNT